VGTKPTYMDINSKLWLFTAAVGGVRISQGYTKLSAPLTAISIVMYVKRRTEKSK